MFLDLSDDDLLAGENDAQVDFPGLVTDAAGASDDDAAVMERIPEVAQALAGSDRYCVEVGRHLHLEGLVGPSIVAVVDEAIEASLLFAKKLAAALSNRCSGPLSHSVLR